MKNENIISNIPKLEIYAMADIIESQPERISEIHFHDELEFLPIYSGRFLCRVDDVDYIAEAGDIVFVNAGVLHETFGLEEGTRWGLLQFRESNYLNTEIRKIIKYSVKLQNLEGSPVRILKSKELFDAVDTALRECTEKNSAYEIMTRSHVLKIIGILYRDGILSNGEEAFNTPAVQKILPAIMYINQNYSEDINLDSMSNMLGFDRSYFCRIFKNAMGATFTEYLNFVRICKAERKLSLTNERIVDISSEVGFASVSYFNKIFKKYKNCSPTVYRTAKYYNNL